MTATKYRSHCDGQRKPIPKKPSLYHKRWKILHGRLLASNKTYVYLQKYFPKQGTEHQNHKQNKKDGGKEQRASGSELQGHHTRMFLQLKVLKTTGGTNSNPANPWYWHAACVERAAAGESDVSLCIQSRNLL